MDKSKVCVTKTVNIAKKCVKKQNLLLFEKNDPCFPPPPKKKEAYTVQPLTCADAKLIKVCTGRDLKRMCPPKLCKCPPKKPKRSVLASIKRLLGVGLKGALAGALLYWSYEIGLWGDSEETIRLLEAQKQKEERDPDLPCEVTDEKDPCHLPFDMLTCPELATELSDKEMAEKKKKDVSGPQPEPETLANKWNRGIGNLFDFLLNGPERIGDFYKWVQKRYLQLTRPKEVCKTYGIVESTGESKCIEIDAKKKQDKEKREQERKEKIKKEQEERNKRQQAKVGS